MSGPEHYRRAEYLADLSIRQREREQSDDPAPLSVLTMAQAQVHATLATIPPDHLAVYEWTQQRLLERLTEDHCLQAFREGWHEADAEGAAGDRVRRGIAAAIKAALL